MNFFESEGRMAILSDDIEGPITVVGDIHGDYRSFRSVRDAFLREEGVLIFLGDYADRGIHGLEVIGGVRSMLDQFGHRVIALKGNHEDFVNGMPRAIPCDLIREVETKLQVTWDEFYPELDRTFLSRLHLSALLPGHVLFVHGGVSSRIDSLNDLVNPGRNVEEDILWSDPVQERGEFPSIRGAGVAFGPDVTEKVLRRLGAGCIVRSHEPRKVLRGPAVEHGGRVITISTTSVCGGKPFYLTIDSIDSFDPDTIGRHIRFIQGSDECR